MTSTSRAAGAARAQDLSWQWVRFSELRPEELYTVVRLREAVFVVEQECAYPDADGRDPEAWHLLAWDDRKDGAPVTASYGNRKLVAYARLFAPGVRYKEASIGRIVTAPEVRGTGVGRLLMAEALRRMESLAPRQTIRIAAQIRLEKFYSEFGFKSVGESYEEDGIIHIDMLR